MEHHQSLNQDDDRAIGFFRLPPRTWLTIAGADRKSFLHNFSTANIKGLENGQACEAFILDGRGKILWFGLVLALPDRLLLSGAGNFVAELVNHLDRYIIREDVQLVDESDSLCGIFVTQANSNDLSAVLAQQFSIEIQGAQQQEIMKRNQIVSLTPKIMAANLEIAGWGYLLFGNRSPIDDLAGRLNQFGFCELSVGQLQRLRIESGTPWYGLDVDDRNLPQELNRDDKAINFSKGCYLGQETVARIDALGHVNQFLVRLGIEIAPSLKADEVPQRDAPLSDPADPEKPIGRITSVTPVSCQGRKNSASDESENNRTALEEGYDNSQTSPFDLIGLGYVRQRYAGLGTVLVSGLSRVEVLKP